MRITIINISVISFAIMVLMRCVYMTMLTSQENRKEQKVHLQSLGLSHAHLELLGVMVMACNVLRIEVVEMDIDLVTL